MSKLFDFDKKNKTETFLIGTDEAGRGPLAGPVVAAAVCFPEITKDIIKNLELVNDSKQLSQKQREFLFDLIKNSSVCSISTIDVVEIEKINILRSSLKAMSISCNNVIKKIGTNVEVFVDGNRKIPQFEYKQTTIVKGDGKSASVAAASILAKVYRDNLMSEYAKEFPQYDWENNKGYGTQKHIDAIKEFGITPLHRESFLKNIFDDEASVQMKLEL